MLRRFSISLVLALTVALTLALAAMAQDPETQDREKGAMTSTRGEYETALRTWRNLAMQGVASAQYNLGLMHAKGLGVPQDHAEAVKWYHRAAEQGLASAQNNLGFMYEKGRGVSRDYGLAVTWLRSAAVQGDADAQYNLGAMYFMGRGVLRDHAEAERWYGKAAAQGHAKARQNLNFMHNKGRSAPTKAAPPRIKAATDQTMAAPARGGFRVQLGAFKSKARAAEEAKRLLSLHKRAIGRRAIVPVRADLGSRGIYYRLRMGPFPNRAKAVSLCRELTARRQNCVLVKP